MSSTPAPHPFSEQQWRTVQSLLSTLDERQALWLSGFLAGQSPGAKAAVPSREPAGSRVLIAYGSETGNCEGLARQMAQRASNEGIAAEVADLGKVRLRQLAKREHLLLICATHGDGDPPEPAQPFFDALLAENAPSLKQLNYAVLALGDSSYEHFCLSGRQLDERLAELGATRLGPRVECDVDFEAPAGEWIANILRDLPRAEAAPSAPEVMAAPIEQAYNKKNPLTVEVLDNVRLSAPERRGPLFHMELALEAENFLVEPGDAVGILAHNPPDLVATILDACDLSGEAAVQLNDEAMPLVQALREHRDLTVASKRLLGYWAELSGSSELRRIASDTKEQRGFLQEHQLRDILALYPARPDPQALVDNLRPLQPRLYDVANSTRAVPDELHLTAKQYRYPFREREELGIASDFLLHLQEGTSLRIYPHRNARFHLPDEPEVPLVLVAEGTGIAPYRAFMQEIGLGQRQHPTWLVFAEQQFEQDFLYQVDWQEARRDGHLQHLDTVFFADQPGRQLSAPLLENAERLRQWLEQGAHVYFCGDKPRLSEAEKALENEIGPDTWKALVKDKRIHRNLY